MINQIILASKSEVRKKILEENKINCMIKPSNVDEDSVKESLLKEKATMMERYHAGGTVGYTITVMLFIGLIIGLKKLETKRNKQ